MKRRQLIPFLVTLSFCLSLLCSSAFAGQTITIDHPLPAGQVVFGNGPEPDGFLPGMDFSLLLNPNNNTVNVLTPPLLLPFIFADVSVYGGATSGLSVSATGNLITVKDSVVEGVVTGGAALSDFGSAAVSNNTVAITSSGAGSVIGGMAMGKESAQATDNSVTVDIGVMGLKSGEIYLYGGRAWSEVSNHSDTSDTFSGDVLATGNSVTLFFGTLPGGFGVSFYGGSAESVVDSGDGNAYAGAALANNGNSMTLTGSVAAGDIHGGSAMSRAMSYQGNAFASTATANNGNNVTINDSVVFGNVYGGKAVSHAECADTSTNFYISSNGNAFSDAATSTGNWVSVNGDTSHVLPGTNWAGGMVFGGAAESIAQSDRGDATSGAALATGNSVTVNDGLMLFATGGRAWSNAQSEYGDTTASNATASNNSVTVNGGKVIMVMGAGTESVASSSYGAASSSVAESSDNHVVINGGEVQFTFGGMASSNHGLATASGNSVVINGGEFSVLEPSMVINGLLSSAVIGGFAESTNGTAFAIDNTVTISGNPTFDPSETFLLGGFGSGVTDFDFFTGNTLNLWNYSGVSAVAGVMNFENYNFLFPTTQSDPVLKVTGTAILGDGAGTGSTVTAISTNAGPSPLQLGDSVVLIDAGILLDATDFTQTEAPGKHGATVSYLWSLDTSDNKLTATVTNLEITPETTAISYTVLTGVTTLIGSGDLVAWRSVQKVNRRGHCCVPFFDITGNWSRYNVGSHIDVDSLSLITGLSRYVKLSNGLRTTVSGFFDYGNGSYNTFNAFSDAANGSAYFVRGDGNTRHYGGGVMGRIDAADGYYADGSFRAGGIRNNFGSFDLLPGTRVSYASDSAYLGTHVGIGRDLQIANDASLDLYGRYFWTHLQGNTVTLSTGEAVDFADVNSHRLRLGGRLSRIAAKNNCVDPCERLGGARSSRFNPYVGVAWEHEFAGVARAMTSGYAIDSPSLRGDTGVGELGVSWKSLAVRGLFIDLGVQGYTGKREGVTASLYAGWNF